MNSFSEQDRSTYRRTRTVTRRAVARLTLGMALSALAMTGASARDGDSYTVPIMLRGVHIFVYGTVNGQPVTFILDTGSGADVLTPDAAARLKLTPSKNLTPVAGAGAVAPPVPQVYFGELGVGASKLTDQTAYLIPLPEAVRCDGLLGTAFLASWVVRIDYEHSLMTLTPRAAFKPPAGAVALTLTFPHNTPHIRATADGKSGEFQIDTGAGDALTLFNAFVERNHLREKHPAALHATTGRGVGGLLSGDVTRIAELDIGSFHLLNPIAELSRQTKGVFGDRKTAGNIGAEVWRRFTVTFDYVGQKLYLEPNGQFNAPFIDNRSGIAIDEDQGKSMIVSVIPKSPGEEAGAEVGDQVLAINGTPIANVTPWDERAIFRAAPGTQVRLRLRRADKSEAEVSVVLRDLL